MQPKSIRDRLKSHCSNHNVAVLPDLRYYFGEYDAFSTDRSEGQNCKNETKL